MRGVSNIDTHTWSWRGAVISPRERAATHTETAEPSSTTAHAQCLRRSGRRALSPPAARPRRTAGPKRSRPATLPASRWRGNFLQGARVQGTRRRRERGADLTGRCSLALIVLPSVCGLPPTRRGCPNQLAATLSPARGARLYVLVPWSLFGPFIWRVSSLLLSCAPTESRPPPQPHRQQLHTAWRASSHRAAAGRARLVAATAARAMRFGSG